MSPTEADTSLELLVLELAGAQCALRLDCVREVVHAVMITPLPGAPDVVEGIIDVRGAVVPVYDLRLRLRLPARPLHPDDRLTIAWTGDRLVAVRAERADRILRIAGDAIDRLEPLLQGEQAVAGAARTADGLVLIHDLARFLDDAERLRLDTALGERA